MSPAQSTPCASHTPVDPVAADWSPELYDGGTRPGAAASAKSKRQCLPRNSGGRPCFTWIISKSRPNRSLASRRVLSGCPAHQSWLAPLPRRRRRHDSFYAFRSHAQELIAQELGFESWQALRVADLSSFVPQGHRRGNEPQLLGAHPQLFVSDVEVSCRFFIAKLGFTVRFQYGKPVFYALVQRDVACLNLRYVHTPVFNREADRDLLSATIPVGNVKALYLEYQSAGAPIHQALRKQPWGAEDFIVRDPDGNLIHFAQSVGPA